MLKLLGYSFEVQFKLGKENQVADALLRKLVREIELDLMVSWPEVQWEQLTHNIKEDSCF